MTNKDLYFQNDIASGNYTDKYIIDDFSRSGYSFHKRYCIENAKTTINSLYTLQDINDNLSSLRSWLQIIAILLIFLILK
ncbi:MAG: hypothetical protein ACI4OE_07165 [Alphaproteobacteria bacterium]